jgi:tRNA dimethylallyltransferase
MDMEKFHQKGKTIIILGPTASGKTALAVELAKKINGEIISADSMQVYRGMDIGTAKPTEAERKGIPHHLIDIRNPDEEWTVSDFVNETKKAIEEIENKGKTPIIVGGTGLYLWSLVNGFSFPITPADKDLRAKLEKEPALALHSRLSSIDPAAAEKIHPNDKKRIIRALEVYELTGKPISQMQKNNSTNSPHLSVGNSVYSLIGLNPPREVLYERINERVDSMISKGLIEEVAGLKAKGYGKKLTSMQALGYKEVLDYLDGKYSREEMIEELKKRTRNFARRQMTWFRRFKDVKWYDDAGQALHAWEKA